MERGLVLLIRTPEFLRLRGSLLTRPLEGDGFEPSVPRQKDVCRHRDRRDRGQRGRRSVGKWRKMPIWHRRLISAADNPMRQ